MHLFLTSTISKVAGQVAGQLDLQRDSRVVFINTAAEIEAGDKSWEELDKKALRQAGFALTEYTLTGKAKAAVASDLATYKYIYVSGGNTAYLLQRAQESGFVDLIKEWILGNEKVYLGTSAGSIICGPKIPEYLYESHLLPRDISGFCFVNFTIMPHWGSEAFRDLYLVERFNKAYHEDQVPLLLLTDNQYVEVFDEGLKIVNTAK